MCELRMGFKVAIAISSITRSMHTNETNLECVNAPEVIGSSLF